MYKKIIVLALLLASGAAYSADAVKPITPPEGYPRGYLHKHYTYCKGEWYPKDYKCGYRPSCADNNSCPKIWRVKAIRIKALPDYKSEDW